MTPAQLEWAASQIGKRIARAWSGIHDELVTGWCASRRGNGIWVVTEDGHQAPLTFPRHLRA